MLGFLTEPTLIDQVNEYEEVGELILASERVVRKIYLSASAVDMDTKLPEVSVSLVAFCGVGLRAPSAGVSSGTTP